MKRYSALFWVIAVIFIFASPAGAAVIKGPYVQIVEKHQASIVWETENDVDGVLEWGTNEMPDKVVNALAGTMHQVTLKNLTPNTSYFYRVTSDGETTPTYEFKTAPTPDVPFRFVSYGDSRSGYDTHRAIVAALESENLDVYMNSGDLVGSGEDLSCWQEHFSIERDLMASKMLMPVIGNHETNGLDVSEYKHYFMLPPNGQGVQEEHYYYSDWGNTRFIVVDCETATLSMKTPQYDWLVDVLQDAWDNPYILHVFLGVHAGPYTAKPDRTGNAQLRAMDGLLVRYGVTAVLSGHDHHYYRGVSPDNLNFIVTGGGGAGLYSCDALSDEEATNYQCVVDYHYVVLDIDGPEITVTAKRLDGQVIETFTWTSVKPYVPYTPEADGDESLLDGDEPDGDEIVVDGDDVGVEDGDDEEVDPDSAIQEQECKSTTGCQSVAGSGDFASVLFLLIAGLAIVIRRKLQTT